PVRFRRVEHRAVVDEARGIEEYVDGAEPLGYRLDRGGVARIERNALGDARLLEAGHGSLVEIACHHPCPLAREGERRRPADASCRRRAEGELALEPIRHAHPPETRCVAEHDTVAQRPWPPSEGILEKMGARPCQVRAARGPSGPSWCRRVTLARPA